MKRVKPMALAAVMLACIRVAVAAGPLDKLLSSPAKSRGLRLNSELRSDPREAYSVDPEQNIPRDNDVALSSAPLKAPLKNEWLVAPIPFHQPNIGWGLQGALGYLYHPFKDEPDGRPWMTGISGLYSSNGSWMGGIFHKMNLDHDRWRATFAGISGQFNYDFFGVGTDAGNTGTSIPLNQEMRLATAQVLRNIGGRWYLGPGYAFLHTRINVDTNASLPPSLVLPATEVDSNLAFISLNLQHDSRDNEFFPLRGGYSKLSISGSDDAWGSDFNYTNIKLDSNRYISVGDRQVLALRVATKWADSGSPFFGLPSFGSQNDLRGYIGGQYRDHFLWATQGEYRYPLWQRLGGVLFAGVGEVSRSVATVNTSDLLPAGGLGLRYTIATQNHVNVRLDLAWGKGAPTYYFGVGEAF